MAKSDLSAPFAAESLSQRLSRLSEAFWLPSFKKSFRAFIGFEGIEGFWGVGFEVFRPLGSRVFIGFFRDFLRFGGFEGLRVLCS